MEKDFTRIGVLVQSLRFSHLLGLFYAREVFTRTVASIEPDVVHTSGLRADTLARKYLADLPRLLTVRNYPFLDYPQKFGKIRGHLMAQFHIQVIRNSPVSVACSQSVAEMFHRNLGLSSLHVIHNGVDMDIFQLDQSKKTLLRQKYNVASDHTVFLSVGSLAARKSPQIIIEAFRKVGLRRGTLIFVGDGPLASLLQQKAQADTNIIFAGQQSCVSDFLQMSDFFVSVSLAEGLPNAVLEAMACGLPCILSDIEPHREILSFDQKAGKITPVGDVEKLANVIDELAKITKMDYESMSKAARGIVHNHFSAQKMSEKYQDVYKKLTQLRTISCIGK